MIWKQKAKNIRYGAGAEVPGPGGSRREARERQTFRGEETERANIYPDDENQN